MSKKHKKQDERPDDKQGGRYYWLQISAENWFCDGTIRKIMEPRNGKTHALILQHLYLIALHGDEIGRVMEGLTPARIDRIKNLARYLRFRPSDVEKTIAICRELDLIVVIDSEIWMRNIYHYIGNPANRELNHFNYLKSLAERKMRATKEGPGELLRVSPATPTNITGVLEDTGKFHGCLQRHGEIERDRTGSQLADRKEKSERFLFGYRQPSFRGWREHQRGGR
jgi:hypothetical protein